MDSKDIVFIINPHSGKKNSPEIIAKIKSIDPNISIFISKSLALFDQFFEHEAKYYKVIVICGGDGTVNTSLKHLINQSYSLAILPNGSGDGFARTLGYTKDIKHLIHSIKQGKTKQVDIFKANGLYSCNIIGVGFDSLVAYEFDRIGKRGMRNYIKVALLAFRNYKGVKIKLKADDNIIEGRYFIADFANAPQYGNNAQIAPFAELSDGRIEVVLIKKIPLYRMPFFLYKMFNGKLNKSRLYHHFKATQVNLESDAPHFHLDGEPHLLNGNLSIEIAGKINVSCM